MEKLDCFGQGQGHSKISKCKGIAESFTTKLGILMHHYYRPECLSKRFVCCLQGQGHSQE